MIIYVTATLDNTQPNRKYSLCGDRDKMINHRKSERRKLVLKEYKTRHACMGKVIHRELCKKLNFTTLSNGTCAKTDVKTHTKCNNNKNGKNTTYNLFSNYIYIYIYCHPQTYCFVVSQLFSVARHVGRLKLASKSAQLSVRLSIRPLGQQVYHVV